MLETKNLQIVTCIKINGKNCFLYCFMALEQRIDGFIFVQLVIAVDRTHLKSKYKGIMFMATCFDGNEQIFSLAFGVVNLENETLYT